MKIKELKDFIKNLPDDMDVYVEYNFNNRYDVEKDVEQNILKPVPFIMKIPEQSMMRSLSESLWNNVYE